MNFNHLLSEKRRKQVCEATQQECYWGPTGNIRSMVGGHVNVSLCCRHCGRREDAFLTLAEFQIQENSISREVQKEQARATAR